MNFLEVEMQVVGKPGTYTPALINIDQVFIISPTDLIGVVSFLATTGASVTAKANYTDVVKLLAERGTNE